MRKHTQEVRWLFLLLSFFWARLADPMVSHQVPSHWDRHCWVQPHRVSSFCLAESVVRLHDTFDKSTWQVWIPLYLPCKGWTYTIIQYHTYHTSLHKEVHMRVKVGFRDFDVLGRMICLYLMIHRVPLWYNEVCWISSTLYCAHL